MKLTQEEKEMLDSVERGEWRRIPNFEQEAARYREIAKATWNPTGEGHSVNGATSGNRYPGDRPEHTGGGQIPLT
uniref:Uncharacterized protein n=1 Tax=Candidatus Kentrum eta TaxID=2126337 RepID=A0A450UXG8_9GAMM|nr:MAG: hypothetical protein BECKH772A_GA0070896_101083 [Candidatus Kentron sp. H]VFJ97228.1 MAG: hypothetical protein BECKH772B_GA0070898_101073 [Candidatus Kentron sp. H]VFK02748.1 MAG: hypothetical protein BECKH772C_GA0070978_101013 [Candidatus Kentron sp. H]